VLWRVIKRDEMYKTRAIKTRVIEFSFSLFSKGSGHKLINHLKGNKGFGPDDFILKGSASSPFVVNNEKL
jgi:hypothetical protein